MVMFVVLDRPTAVANNKEYQKLFGDRASTILSVYEHKHDHTHSPDGTLKKNIYV